MAITYKAIASVTVGSGGASSIQFTSIPGTYTDLCLIVSARSAHNDGYESGIIAVNGSPTYSFRRQNAYDVNTNEGTGSNTWFVVNANSSTYSPTNLFNIARFYFPNYTSSANKSTMFQWGVPHNGTGSLNLSWVSAGAGMATLGSAITTITLTTNNAANYMQHSTATLYGINATV